jgi:cyanophycinase
MSAYADCPAVPVGVEHNVTGTFDARPAAVPVRRVVLMGGSSEVAPAARLFVEAAGGGDVLVLRASGSSTSYNDYFASGVGASPAPASAGSIRIDSAAAGADAGVLCRVARAEAIWLAGGNQWNYLGRWPAALHDALAAAAPRGVPIGGTSAGAMSLGELAFDARAGSAVSDTVLANPFHDDVAVSRSPFAQPELAGVLVDTHFMQRSREGRLLVFLARGRALLGAASVTGIGLDERAALVIEDGRFTVLAGAPERYAWVYRLTGDAVLRPGAPLSLDGIERVRMSHGDTGAWPIDVARDFAPGDIVRMRVRAGTVETVR